MDLLDLKLMVVAHQVHPLTSVLLLGVLSAATLFWFLILPLKSAYRLAVLTGCIGLVGALLLMSGWLLYCSAFQLQILWLLFWVTPPMLVYYYRSYFEQLHASRLIFWQLARLLGVFWIFEAAQDNLLAGAKFEDYMAGILEISPLFLALLFWLSKKYTIREISKILAVLGVVSKALLFILLAPVDLPLGALSAGRFPPHQLIWQITFPLGLYPLFWIPYSLVIDFLTFLAREPQQHQS